MVLVGHGASARADVNGASAAMAPSSRGRRFMGFILPDAFVFFREARGDCGGLKIIHMTQARSWAASRPMESPEEMGRIRRLDRPMALLAVAGFPAAVAGRRIWANAMRWLELLASGLFAYEVTHSAFAVTAVVAARQLPQLFLGALAGAVSEAVNRKTIVMATLLGPAAVSTVLAVLAGTGHLALWHVALGNLLAGVMWSTEMSTRRRMVGEVAGSQRIVPTIASDLGIVAATRMIGPLLGGLAYQWLHMRGAYTVTALVQLAGAYAMSGLVHAQVTRPLTLARILPDIVEGLAYARTKPVILLVFGITIVTNAFAFSLFRPRGAAWLGRFPRLARPRRSLGAGKPRGRADRRRADRGGPPAHGPPACIRRRLGDVHGGADRDGGVALVRACLLRAVRRRLRHCRLRQHAIDPDADRGAARHALAPDGRGHGRHRHGAAGRAGRGPPVRPYSAPAPP